MGESDEGGRACVTERLGKLFQEGGPGWEGAAGRGARGRHPGGRVARAEPQSLLCSLASQEVLAVKNPPANAGDVEMQARSLGWEDPLEKETAPHSSILAWRIPWTEEPGRLKVGHD